MTKQSQTPPTTLSQVAYARYRGWDKSRVTRLKEAGMLVMTDGMVDVAATDRLIEENRDPSKQGVADYHAQQRINKAEGLSEDKTPPNSDSVGVTSTSKAIQIRTAKEYELLKAVRRENALAEGKLVAIDEVRQKYQGHVRLLRQHAQELIKRLAVELDLSEDRKRRMEDIFDDWEREVHTGMQRMAEDAKGKD